MKPTVGGAHRIWLFAGIAAAMLMLVPALFAATGHLLGWGRDPDVASVIELIVFFLIVSCVPAFSLSFGVMAPLAIVIDRVALGRTSRIVNVMAGIAVGLTGLAAFLWGSSVLAWQPGESFWQVMSRPINARPEAAVAGVTFFALVGMIVAAGIRHRPRPAI